MTVAAAVGTAKDYFRSCEGFQTPAVTNIPTRTAAGVWKPSRDETARKGTYWAVPARLLWGFGCGRATAEVSSEGRLSGEDVDAGRRRCVLAICGPVYRRRSVGLLRGEGRETRQSAS